MYHEPKSLRDQFIAANGDDALNVDGLLIFSNGAWMDQGLNGGFSDPSGDARKRAGFQVLYYEEKLRRATESFHRTKDNMRANVKEAQRMGWPGITSGQDDLTQLKQLQAVVKDCQAALAKHRAAYDDARPAQQKAMEQAAAAAAPALAAAMSAIDEIKI